MTKLDKLRKRLLSRPKDFTWTELVVIMQSYGYELKTTGGSSRKFLPVGGGNALMLHEPHPGNILKPYQIQLALELLRSEGHI